jgi:predicted GNAT family acetyltransferase
VTTEHVIAGADPRQLERPVWSALTTTHARFAIGNDRARRYRPDMAPMCSVAEINDACMDALTALMAPGDIVGLFNAEPVAARPGLTTVVVKFVHQMVYDRDNAEPAAGAITTLTPADVPEMLELVELTKPGPFAPRTIALGTYIGIRSGGRLIAMAGERMRFDGFTEVSGVCTHPDHRGRGHSSLLVNILVRQILERGERPFLHVFDDNTRAAALYGKLGFSHRRTIAVTVLQREA